MLYFFNINIKKKKEGCKVLIINDFFVFKIA